MRYSPQLDDEPSRFALFDAVTLPIVLCRGLTVTYANPAARSLLSLTDGYQGTSLTDLISMPQIAALASGLAPQAAGNDDVALCLTRRDGTPCEVSVTVKELEPDLHLMELRTLTPFTDFANEADGALAGHERLRFSQKVFESIDDGLMVTDSKGTIVLVNPAFTRVTGYAPKEVLGQTPRLLRSEYHDPEFYQKMWSQIRDRGLWEGEIWNRRKDGALAPQGLTIKALPEPGHPTFYVGLLHDLAKSKEEEQRLHNYTNFDLLTGLANRLRFLDHLRHAIGRARRARLQAVLLFIDLKQFNAINDTLGHRLADQVLREVGMRLREFSREPDMVARLGGDEFAVILEDLAGQEDAEPVAQRILSGLAQPITVENRTVTITASAGISVYPADGETAERLLQNAATAMHKSREDRPTSYRFFTPQMDEEARYRRIVRTELARAETDRDFHLHFQPKVDISDGRVAGVEALLRWTSPVLGPVSPATFVPILEQTGRIREIGTWVLSAACRQKLALDRAGLDHVSVAVNLSPQQLLQTDLPEKIETTLHSFGLPGDGLDFEITESLLMRDPEMAATALRRIRDLGVTIAIDDFGTGYSSLSYLKRFPIDIIKIDRSFIKDMLDSPDNMEIVRAIINMAHALGRITIAEGVETEEQAAQLSRFRCHQLQGYLYSRPLPADQLLNVLDHRTPASASLH